jgi:hypothetical protein
MSALDRTLWANGAYKTRSLELSDWAIPFDHTSMFIHPETHPSHQRENHKLQLSDVFKWADFSVDDNDILRRRYGCSGEMGSGFRNIHYLVNHRRYPLQ